MRIVMVCETLTEGCAPNVTVLEIRNNLRKMNHEVHLFCPSTEKIYVNTEDSDVHLVPTTSIYAIRDIVYQALLFFSLLGFCLKHRPKFIYSRPVISMISPALVSKVLRIPHIMHLAGDMVEALKTSSRSLILRVPYGVLERINFKLSARVIVTTSNNMTNHQKKHNVSPEKIVVIPNGANVDIFRPIDIEEARKQLGIEKDCLCVGFAGNLTPYEGVAYLIESAPTILGEMPDTKLLIVGDGLVKHELEELVRKHGVGGKFIFTGGVPYEKVPAYIAAMDVCVAPLIRAKCERAGISPLKLGEYMACERPVVASDINGVGPVLREAKAGIPVPLENPYELAQAIIKLLKDKHLREEMGRNGRKFVLENLSWEAATKKLVQAYESVIADRQK